MTITLSGAAQRTTTTAADGSYLFIDLSDGFYSLAETQPAGFSDGTDSQGLPVSGSVTNDRFVNVELRAGTAASNYNFGEQQPAVVNSISGFVYIDANNNGQRDTGEASIPNITITLSGTVDRTTQTGSDGSYQFSDLPVGSYSITESDPTEYDDGQESQGNPQLGQVENDRFVNVDLGGGVVATGYNFGERQPILTNSIGGFVYVDANQNGQKDTGEPAIPNVTITLNGPVQQTVQTSSDGAYRFDNLPSGIYTISESQPAAYVDGVDSLGTPSLGRVENDQFLDLDLSGGLAAANYNFGEQQPATLNSISGFVYIDANDNGQRDTGEAPLSNITITLSGTIDRTTQTASDGSYQFTELPAGTYSITESDPTAYDDGQESQGSPELGQVENDRFANLNLNGGVVATGYNFGERQPILTNSIGGFVYVDTNQNGQKDTEESAIPNVTITLDGPVQQTVQTSSDGAYRFDNLPSGVYTISESQPAAYVDGSDSFGTPSLGRVQNDQFLDLNLSGGITAIDYNFGESLPPTRNSIAGYVYADANGDGIKNAGESAIAGVRITLDGPVNLTATTRTDGSYEFSDLPNGRYDVSEQQPVGYLDGIDRRGTPALGLVENDHFVGLELTGGTDAVDYNFGETIPPALNSIGGFVYVDTDGNGLKDPSELAIAGVMIALVGPIQLSMLTRDDGSYLFDNLPAGTYSVAESHPANFTDGLDTPGQPQLGAFENDRFSNLSLVNGTHATNYNFGEAGLRPVNSISGMVYVDVNNNGIKDPPELVIANAIVTLDGPIHATLLTDDNGYYRFFNLPDGVYSVSETQHSALLDGIDSPGVPLLGRVENDRFADLELIGGIDAVNYNFAERGLKSINKSLLLATTPSAIHLITDLFGTVGSTFVAPPAGALLQR